MKFIKNFALLTMLFAFGAISVQAQDATAPKKPTKPLMHAKSASVAPASEQNPTGGVKAPPPPPKSPTGGVKAPPPPPSSNEVTAPTPPTSAKRPAKRPTNPRVAVEKNKVSGGAQAAPVGKVKLEGTRQVKKSNTKDMPVGEQHQ